MAAEGMDFPWRWTSGTIPLNLRVIWGMSVKPVNRGQSRRQRRGNQRRRSIRTRAIAGAVPVRDHVVCDLGVLTRRSRIVNGRRDIVDNRDAEAFIDRRAVAVGDRELGGETEGVLAIVTDQVVHLGLYQLAQLLTHKGFARSREDVIHHGNS